MNRLLAIVLLFLALTAPAAVSPPYMVPVGTNVSADWWTTKPGTNRITNWEGWATVNSNTAWMTNHIRITSNALQSAISAIPGGQSQWPVSAITNAGTAAYSNAAAFLLAGGKALTAGTADYADYVALAPSDTSGLIPIVNASSGYQPITVNTTNLTWDGIGLTSGNFITKDFGAFYGNGVGLTNIQSATDSLNSTITPSDTSGLIVISAGSNGAQPLSVNTTNLTWDGWAVTAGGFTTKDGGVFTGDASGLTNIAGGSYAAKTNATIYDNILLAKTDSASYWWQTNDTAKQQLRFLGEASTEPLAIDWSDGAGYGIHTPNLYASAAYVPITNAGYVGTDGNGKIVLKSAPSHPSMWEFNVSKTINGDTPTPLWTNAWASGPDYRKMVNYRIIGKAATSGSLYIRDEPVVHHASYGVLHDTYADVEQDLGTGGMQVTVTSNNVGLVWTVTGLAGENVAWHLVGASDGYWNSQ